jgi:hypothetical protein
MRIPPEEMIKIVYEGQEHGLDLILDIIVRDRFTDIHDVVNYLNLANSCLFEKSVAWVQKDGKFYTKKEYSEIMLQQQMSFLPPFPAVEVPKEPVFVPEPVPNYKIIPLIYGFERIVNWLVTLWGNMWKKE